jgi:hypothetical protein
MENSFYLDEFEKSLSPFRGRGVKRREISPRNRSTAPHARGPDLSLETGHCLAKRAIEIDCKEVWRQISNYLDNDVEPELRASMTSHFKDCAHCSAVLDGTRNVVELVGDGRAFKIPASQRLYKKLNEHVAARQRKRR